MVCAGHVISGNDTCQPLSPGVSSPDVFVAVVMTHMRTRHGRHVRHCNRGPDVKPWVIRVQAEEFVAMEIMLAACWKSAWDADPMWSTSFRLLLEVIRPPTTPILQKSYQVATRLPAAALVFKGRSSKQPFCGGALVNAQWVLTAAHCMHGTNANKVYVALGEYDYSGVYFYENEGLSANIARAFLHPDFDPRTVSNDFALLLLSEPVDLDRFPHIRPVCMPTVWPEPDQQVTVSGWGKTRHNGPASEKLKKASFSVITKEECVAAYGDKIKDMMFCAGDMRGGTDACQGDSGGPLIHKKPGFRRFELMGVTSWGFECAREGFPGVYATVLYVESWWKDLIGDPDCPRGEL